MKGILITAGVVVLATIVGLITFSILDEGTYDDGAAMVSRLITSIVVAAILGVGFVAFALPQLARLFANFIYDQTPQEYIAPTHLDAARSKKMQGEYEEAIELLKQAIEEDAPDRLAWVEMSQIQLENLDDPETAITTLETGFKSTEWEMDDDINFRFRIAELYLEHYQDRDAAVNLFKSILEDYPENELYAAQARSELHSLGVVA